MARKAKAKRKRAPKTILKLPDLEQSKSAVLNSLTSPSSQRSYDHAIREFIDWYCSEPRLTFNKTVVTRYRISLEQRQYAPSTINLRLVAVRRLAYEASDCGLLSPDLAAGIRRVKGARRLGVRIGNWLTAEEGKLHQYEYLRRCNPSSNARPHQHDHFLTSSTRRRGFGKISLSKASNSNLRIAYSFSQSKQFRLKMGSQ